MPLVEAALDDAETEEGEGGMKKGVSSDAASDSITNDLELDVGTWSPYGSGEPSGDAAGSGGSSAAPSSSRSSDIRCCSESVP